MGLSLAVACADGSIVSPSAVKVAPGGEPDATGTDPNEAVGDVSIDGASVQGNVTVSGSDIGLRGTGFTANVGKQMFAVVIDANTNELLTRQAGFALIDAGGNFQMSWKNLVIPGQKLYIAYYVDVNGDAVCNAIPTDEGWELRLRTLNVGTVVSVTPALAQRSVCEMFGTYNITFDSNNAMTAHGYPGHYAYAAVVDTLDNSLVGEVQGATVSTSGQVVFSWPGLLVTHHHYAIALCVDTANSGSCDTSALYTFTTNAVASDVIITFAGAAQVTSHAFSQLWPHNLTLPPPPAAAIPSLDGL